MLEWTYEQEIRLVSNRSGKHNFDSDALCGIIVGTKMAKETIKQLTQYIKRYASIRIKEAILDLSKNRVTVDGFNNTSVVRHVSEFIDGAGKAQFSEVRLNTPE